MHQFGVCAHHGMLLLNRHAGGNAAQIHIATLFDCLLQQSVYDLPLDWHGARFSRHNDFHGNVAAIRKQSGRCQQIEAKLKRTNSIRSQIAFTCRGFRNFCS